MGAVRTSGQHFSRPRGLAGANRVWLRWLCIGLALAAFAALRWIPLPEVLDSTGGQVPLPETGRVTMAIVALAMVLWSTEAIPFAATGLSLFLLFPMLGVATAEDVLANGLGHPLMLFFLSLFLLSSAFMQVGLSHRVSTWLLVWSRGRANLVVLFALAAGAVLTFGVTGLAATSVLLSVALEILDQTHQRSSRTNFGRALLIASGWGPIVGSVGTPAGSGANPLTIGYLKELVGVEVTFVDWMTLGIPTVLVLIPITWLVLRWAFPGQRQPLLSQEELAALREDARRPMTRREIAFLVVFGCTLCLWIATPAIEALTNGRVVLSLQAVGLAAALIMFLPGLDLLAWPPAERHTAWGALLVLAAGLASGMLLYRTGAARWLAWLLLGGLGTVDPVPRVFIIVAAVCLLRLIFTSSTSAAAILVPLIIALAQDLGADPWLFAAPVAFATCAGFIMPFQAASNVVTYSAGHFSIKDMAKAGIVFTVLVAVVIAAVMLLVGSVTGRYRL
jgi:sodium-dependent dicarboxylate transporter 2/3/5